MKYTKSCGIPSTSKESGESTSASTAEQISKRTARKTELALEQPDLYTTSARKLAKRLGVSAHVIYLARKKGGGVAVRPKNKVNPEVEARRAAVTDQPDLGHVPDKVIGDRIGETSDYVCRVRNEQDPPIKGYQWRQRNLQEPKMEPSPQEIMNKETSNLLSMWR